MERYDIDKLRSLSCEGVAQRLGIKVEHHKCLCPFHEDHHPSMSFKVNKNTYRCFVCGESGGPIDLVMKYLKKDFREACRWLNNEEVISNFKFQNSNLSPQTSNLKSQTSFDASRYSRFFERPWLSPEARKFLFEERRLDERVVRWCRLTSWRDRQGINWLQIPYYDREGKLIGIQNRNLGLTPNPSPKREGEQKPHIGLEGDATPRFRFPQGAECSIYNLPVLNLLQPDEPLFITEGCSDCWAMLSAGHKAIAIPSATLLKARDVEQLSILNSQLSIKFHMYPDRDAPGERLFMQLQSMLPNLEHHHLPPECKDFSDYYVKRLRLNDK